MKIEMQIPTNCLVEGMTLSRDVEAAGCLVLAENTKLSSRLIHYLNTRGITEVWVYETQVNAEQQYERKHRENFAQFQSIAAKAQNGEAVQQTDLKDIIQNYIDVPSKQSLLKFTQGIRQVDQYTYEHSLNVCYLSIMLGKWAKYPYIHELAQAALLHDLGKTRVDSEILNKPGALTNEEWVEMKKHPLYGYEFLQMNSDFSEEVAKGVLYHHEKINGTGYPHGLKSRMIPEIARIISIADVFDALTTNRVYRKKMDIFEVLQFMHSQYQNFDPEFLQLFIDNMMDYLIGEEVLLSNGQVGKIIFKSPLNPFEILIQTGKDFITLGHVPDVKVAQVMV